MGHSYWGEGGGDFIWSSSRFNDWTITLQYFYFLEDHGIADYADDSTPYSAKKNHELVIEE